MTATATIQTTSILTDQMASDLRSSIAGEVIVPGEDGYDAARTIWNGMIDKQPALIVRPAGVSDVIATVSFARQTGVAVSIKGGGHNVAGHAVSQGGLMIDMGMMKSVHVDPVRRTARVEAGATWADFDRETAVFGLATTAGVISSTGVAGLTLGGGIGWLVGKHGLSIDNLISVELVTADGTWLRASENEHPDLFWALRGGGGNFGVVTSFEFQLHPVSDVLAGYLVWGADDAAEILEFYRTFTENNPEEMTTYFQLGTDPESGIRVAMLVVFFPEVNEANEKLVDQIRGFKEPLADFVGPMTYKDWQRGFDQEFPHGLRYYWKGVLLSELNDGAIQAVLDHAVDPPMPGCAVAIEHYRGVMNRVAPDATAFANRDARYQIVIIGGWESGDDDQTGIDWVRTFNDAAAKHSLGAAFLNFNSAEHAERESIVRAGFRHNYERLARVKRDYDPENLFNQNNNIKPS
jgi:FAD/FMN-containing dehydrogenase